MALADDPKPVLVDLAAGRDPRIVSESGTVTAWLEVDLGGRFPIHSVVLHPRKGTVPPEPGEVTVAVSQDGMTWTTPDTAGWTATPDALVAVIVSDEQAWARAMRIAVPDPTRIANVIVRADEAAVDLIALRAMLGLDVTLLNEKPGANVYVTYNLRSAPGRTSHALVGLSLFENGAFGNCLVQYIIAVSIAKALNLKYIKVPKVDRSKVIFLTERLTCDGITFIPPDEPLPPDGYFLSGLYFDPTQFERVTGLQEPTDSRAIVQNVIRPLFNGLPKTFPPKPDDQLLIHIRSGDIFSTWVDPHYPQPPFAFYRMVIDRLLAEGRIRSVKLVFENRLNPVIAEVETYAERCGLAVEIQSESLISDVAALVDGRYLVFGLGTFGPAICHLSERVEQVFYFASNWPQGFQSIPTIGKVVEVRDLEGRYMKVGEWQNTDAQRRTMIDYPAEALAFDDA
ncbi:coagulation factor 5 8 type domain-containing protein [Methylobacterium sp. P1-11]|uniref:discoidin domain-containing protein n=1 Tax=Methylobacterium sp. P1-11 TaxID=2024616 RepID=UPI0011EBEA1E|nr:discoidin domain-containing protein [Methylobacterium sp. P1-11]KAA0122571.1 coagulation factor 5 8 type domain-containing protein [Methylobacterium sp. P1-11]